MNAIIIFLTLTLSSVKGVTYSEYSPIFEVQNIFENQQLDRQARYYGGDKECFNYIANAIKNNNILKKVNNEGTVYVRFVVNPDGTVCNVELIKGLNESINDQCLKIISEMPKWKAGELNFEKVSTSIVLPIIFGNSDLVNN